MDYGKLQHRKSEKSYDSPLEGLHESWDPLQTIQFPKLPRDIACLNTLPNYTLAQNIAELYPILRQYRRLSTANEI